MSLKLSRNIKFYATSCNPFAIGGSYSKTKRTTQTNHIKQAKRKTRTKRITQKNLIL